MEEKKLTDEEIVKAFELCVMDGVGCAECPYSEYAREGLGYCNGDIEEDVLDLIHRLQSENAELQKQVDELQSKNTELQSQVDNLMGELDISDEAIVRLKKQCSKAVKDTAKEICLEIVKDMPKPIKDKWLEWFKERYGVEVE